MTRITLIGFTFDGAIEAPNGYMNVNHDNLFLIESRDAEFENHLSRNYSYTRSVMAASSLVVAKEDDREHEDGWFYIYKNRVGEVSNMVSTRSFTYKEVLEFIEELRYEHNRSSNNE